MTEEEMYNGFITKEKQKEYEAYLKNKLGEDHHSFAECEKNMKGVTKAQWEKIWKESDANMRELATLKEKDLSLSSSEEQVVIRNHYEWLKGFWTPNKESYTALGQGYTGFEWKKFFGTYDSEHPKLAMFLAEGMKVFAERELQ